MPGRHHRHRRIAVQAPASNNVISIGEHCFAGFEVYLLSGPIYFAPVAVGNVALHIGLQGHLSQILDVHRGVMIAHRRVAHGALGL